MAESASSTSADVSGTRVGTLRNIPVLFGSGLKERVSSAAENQSEVEVKRSPSPDTADKLIRGRKVNGVNEMDSCE